VALATGSDGDDATNGTDDGSGSGSGTVEWCVAVAVAGSGWVADIELIMEMLEKHIH
jgi:hypothetical protein